MQAFRGQVKFMSETTRRWAGTSAWILLVLASMVLIGYGLARSTFFIWAPEPALLDAARVGGLFIDAGCMLSLAAAVWSHLRGNPAWVTVCVGLPAVLVGWAALIDAHSLMRHLAAAVAFPLALAGVAEVIWARGHRQRG
ncbi:hypothetical protein QFZ60_003439 [Arthrobacter sp. B2I5]|nr:hypothetical protein [Arthrobacter sp. B2I5]